MDFSASLSHVSNGEQISIQQTQKKNRGVNKHKMITCCKKPPSAVKTNPTCFLSTRVKDASLAIPYCLIKCKVLPEAFPTAIESTEGSRLTTAELG